jgi:hypothetical protein
VTYRIVYRIKKKQLEGIAKGLIGAEVIKFTAKNITRKVVI